MAKRKRHVRINPVANAPILRKGGEHTVSRSGERSREKQKVRKLMNNIKAGFSGLDAVWGERISDYAVMVSRSCCAPSATIRCAQ